MSDENMTNEMNRDEFFAAKPKASLLKRVTMFFLPILVIAGAVFGSGAMGAFKPTPETKDETPRTAPVLVADVMARDTSLKIQSQGEVRPRTEINLAMQVGGKINYISPAFVEGGQFTKGDILVRLETTDYDLRVTQAQANVAQAETVLTRELSEGEIARLDWEDLGEGDPSPLTLREPQAAEARARLASAQALLDEAKLSQSRTVLRAPFNGRVREQTAALGEFISPAQKLGRAYAIDVAEVKLPLTDADLSKLGIGIGFQASAANPGPAVEFSAEVGGKVRKWQGRIVRTNSGYDASTRVLYAYGEVKRPYTKGADEGVPFASGLFVNASIAGRKINDALVIPRTALRGNDKVYIAAADDTLTIRTVSVISSSRYEAIIASGIRVGDKVITSPVRGVAEGMKIDIADKDQPSAIAVTKEN